MLDELGSPNDNIYQSPPKEPGYSGIGLAVASLALGVVSIPLSILLIGGLCGLIGFILAAIHLSKKKPARVLAIWGLVLSILGILATAGIVVYSFNQLRHFQADMAVFEDETYKDWIGIESPDFTVTDLEGNKITLSQLKGRLVILDFWATWCPPCRKEIPHFKKLRNTYDDKDLVLVAISNENIEVVKKFKDKHKINYPLATEKNLPAPYDNITSIPTTFFIDRKGLIQNVITGYHPFDQLNNLLSALDEKKEPEQNSNQ